jgi:Cu+-exporting ATPase
MSPKTCYHCGDICADIITTEEKSFCCNGCKQVYLLLSENNLCNYYQLDSNPGIKARGKFTGERFAYLEDESIINKLVLFKSDEQINVCFSLPQMHCSSCIFLLEKLHQIESGIILSRVNFQQKNIFISFNPTVISLRKVVELLSFIGYEPSITLQDSLKSANKKINKKQLIQIGVAGFCFSNIMMLSFPDYFSHGNIEQYALQKTFSWIILVLSLPVLFYSASSIFGSAFRGLRQKEINIDVPIALASLITFSRSYYEIISGTGAGYLDSGAGIIFFMLIGRWFQNKTYDSLSFDRQYQSYFPLGVTIKKNGIEQNIPITKLEVGDFIITRNNEMIPADAILVSDSANIDYSFVNGENTTSGKKVGDFLYAGGKQIGKSIVVKALKLPSQSYITELWNNSIFEKNKETKDSFIHPWSRYFTIVLFSIAFIASVFWYFHDTAKVLPVLTSVLIVACPCSLLLSSTFTFGNMLRLTGKHKLFLKNATVLETMAKINHIVFDKTGTITGQDQSVINYVGIPLTDVEMNLVKSITAHSSHVLSHSLYKYLSVTDELSEIESFSEVQGSGIVATSNGLKILLGNKKFTSATNVPTNTTGSSEVHITINDIYKGYFEVKHPYRKDIDTAIKELSKSYQLHILSGDNDSERKNIEQIFGTQTPLLFSVSPAEKLDYIKKLQQQKGATVLMIGDGLNDAGALMQSDVGIAVSENKANFSPACDGIIDGDALKKIPAFMKYARMGKRNVSIGFILSVLYNIAGISFAVQGLLSPVVAAILMPISSISIVTTAMLVSEWTGRFLRN